MHSIVPPAVSKTMHIYLVVVLATLQVCNGYPWNVAVQDTPEVAHAKAEHFAAVAKAKSHDAGHSGWAPVNSWATPHYAPEPKYHGPVALPPGYDHHGAPLPVLDTPEVAHAKAERIAALAKAGGSVYPSTGPDPWSHAEENSVEWAEPKYDAPAQWAGPKYEAAGPKYHGPFAYSPGYDKHGAPLPVVETPEVQHAKAEHFAAYAKVASHVPSVGHKWKRSIHEHAVSAAEHAHYAAVAKAKGEIEAAAHYHQPAHSSWAVPHYAPEAKYHGPVALPPGYDKHGAPLPVLDTPEVAHTKAERLAAVAKAGGSIHPAPYSPYYSEEHESSSSWSEPHHAQQYASAHIKYHGPIALPPGYDKHGAPLPVKDTPEVAAGKAHHYAQYAKIAADHAAHHHHQHW